MNSALKSFQPFSKTTITSHIHTVFSFQFSPVKQQRLHPLFPLLHIFQSPTLSFRNLYSHSRIFIKTCNNTDCSFSVRSCLSDMKEEVRIFRQQLHRHMKEKLVSGKGHPPLHRLHFLQCITIQTHPYHGAIHPPTHSATP